MRPNNCIVSKINYRLPYELNCRLLTSEVIGLDGYPSNPFNYVHPLIF